jgi:hypothetical protein
MLRTMRAGLLILLLVCGLAAGEMPPSPSTAPGIRIWPAPAFTHWPPIAYPDERRNAAVGLPVRTPGARGAWRWDGQPPIELRLPDDAEATSGLVDLSLAPGRRELVVELPEGATRLALRVEPGAVASWPISGLAGGFPVDEAGVPVVLLASRPQPARERTWALLRPDLPRPAGRALLVGDPLAAFGGDAWAGLDAETRPATDPARPHHAVIAALAALPTPLPRTLLWCPGNGALARGEADPEEARLLGLLRERFTALGAAPLLVLALPPRPLGERLAAADATRRDELQREADRTGWRVIDLARSAGPPEDANRVGDNAFAPYPVGEAQARMRETLRGILAR